MFRSYIIQTLINNERLTSRQSPFQHLIFQSVVIGTHKLLVYIGRVECGWLNLFGRCSNCKHLVNLTQQIVTILGVNY